MHQRLAARACALLAASFAPAVRAHAPALDDALTLDPWVLAGLASAILLYGLGVSRLWRRGIGYGVRVWQVCAYTGGIVALVAALVWPLDGLSEHSLAAHMVQHMLLVGVAPPLLVIGLPVRAFAAWAPARALLRVLRTRAWQRVTRPSTAFVLHSAVLWVWHVPAPFQAALQHAGAHALEHASFLVSAVIFWWALLAAGRAHSNGYGISALLTLAMIMHTGVLGALLTFASHPLYPVYGEAGWLGLSPLEDQQLAGLIMWVPGGLLYLGLGLALAQAWLRLAQRRDFTTAPARRD